VGEATVTGSSPVGCLAGVGPRRAEALGQAGLGSVGDLLFHLPLRYEDKRMARPLGPLDLTEKQLYLLLIQTVKQSRMGRGGRLHRLEARAVDQSGATVTLHWINQRFRSGAMTVGNWYYVYGRLVSEAGTTSSTPSGRQIENPDLNPASGPDLPLESGPHLGRLVPVYRRAGGIGSRVLRTAMFKLFRETRIDCGGESSDVLMAHGFPEREELFRGIHCPPDHADLQLLSGGRSLWHRGLAFEELYLQQKALAEKRRKRLATRKKTVLPAGSSDQACEQLITGLESLTGFSLTRGQKQSIGEIIDDLVKPYPMRRLLQGEVGCGKTVVAYAALFHAACAGHQVALMVPTEALAWQHFRRLEDLLDSAGEDHPLRLLAGQTILVSGGTDPGQRRQRERRMGQPGSLIAIGTHALLSSSVVFRDLSLAVVDEQQRFGVGQRETLRSKGANPDLLVISATPIPRTMSLRLCGDMDLSRINDVPHGRRTVETLCLDTDQAVRAMELLEGELDAGRQGFIVCPRVKSRGGTEKRAAETVFQKFRSGRLSRHDTDLLHGGMNLEESRSVMDRFQQGRTRLLVTTTVVEVGLDVERATVMIVLEPERFGLSQLHQLRGRIGRGKWPGLFILLRSMDDTNSESTRRLAVLTSSADGFFIAEEDMRLRGGGELTGLRQAGAPGFRGAAGADDGRLLRLAREAAFGRPAWQ
jgi:ATP-dependent DNA helicase RecG